MQTITGTITDVIIRRGILIRDEDNEQEIMVNVRNTNRFKIGDRCSIAYDGHVIKSVPPQVNASNIQILRPPFIPVPPIGNIRPPVGNIRPPIGNIRPPVREMRARVVRRESNFLIVQNNADNQVLRIDTNNARFFCPGTQVTIYHRGTTPGQPPRINLVDILPNC